VGQLADRTQRHLTDGEVSRISGTYHVRCGEEGAGAYENVAGFCKSAPLEIRKHGHVLTTEGEYGL